MKSLNGTKPHVVLLAVGLLSASACINDIDEPQQPDPAAVTDMVTVWATLPSTPPHHTSTRISVAQNVFLELQIQ